MLEKGALELVNQPGPGFYSMLLLVQKATGVCMCVWPVIDLSSLNGYIPLPSSRYKQLCRSWNRSGKGM